MSAHGLLDQLLRSGRDLLEGRGGGMGRGGSGGLGGLGSLGDLANLGGLGKLGAGAGAAGVLGALLGSKRGRSYGGKALKYGSIAALGLMAYKAYTSWQAQQQAQGATAPGGAAGAARAGATTGSATWTPGAVATEPRTLDRVSPAEAEQHSRAVLLAMIAAAKADGHLDDRERELIENELARLDGDAELRRWHEDALRRPLDPAAVAQAATTPEIAAEMYLATLLMVDETSFMERAYLDELARQLKLPDGLKAQLEAQALQS